MTWRKWKFEDIPELVRLEAEMFKECWNSRMIADSLLNDRFYGVLLEEGETITAYGGMTTLFDEGEIELVATSEMYRRCGRGNQILGLLEEEARRREVKTLFLEVRESNLGAQALYTKNGFIAISKRPKYYPDGEDAIVMKKELN